MRTRAPLSRRSFLSFGMAMTIGIAGCTDVDIHAPDVWDGWDSDFPGTRSRDFTAQVSFESRFDAATLTALSLTGMAGTVELVGGPGSHVVIQGVRRVRSDSQADADRSLQSLAVEASQRGTTLHVSTRQPERTGGRAYEVDYRIVVPDGIDLFVELVAGEIDAVATVAEGGVIDLSNVAGGIALEIPSSTSASLRAEVVTGSIHVSNLVVDDRDPRAGVLRGTLGSGDGSITLSTVAGVVTVTGR